MHAHITGRRNTTFLEDLALETSNANEDANGRILEFLSEESIIDRTQDCWTYFTQDVLPLAATHNVI